MPKRYELVLNDIVNKIKNGEYKKNDMLPTEKEMINLYGVSRITIQKAMSLLVQDGVIERISGKGTFVKAEPGECDEKEKSEIYAVITPFQQPATLSVIQGAQDVMYKRNYYLTVQFTDYDAAKEIDVITKLLNDGISGFIVYSLFSDRHCNFYRKLVADGVNIVFIDKELYGLTANFVLSNNFEGSYRQTKYLLENGHRSMAFLSYDYNWGSSLKDRCNGFLQCMYDNGMSESDFIVEHSAKESDDLPHSIEKILKANKNISALVCATDSIAKEAYSILRRRGYRIPEDISVTGFGNDYFSSDLQPSLTTVNQDYYAIGKVAARLLLNVKAKPNKNAVRILIPTELVERDSVRSLLSDGETKENT